jgi:hypothetical protein
MSMPTPTPPGGPRASRGVKLVLMGVAGAALLYSCAPGVGAGLGALPYLWFLPNPFYRPSIAAPCPPGAPNCDQATSRSGSGGSGYGGGSRSTTTTDAAKASPGQAAPTTSQRGGFGSTGSTGSTGSS